VHGNFGGNKNLKMDAGFLDLGEVFLKEERLEGADVGVWCEAMLLVSA
jgi:hypothetical protein